MKRIDLRRRALAFTLAMSLMMSMMGLVYATDDGKCSCGATYNRNVLHQANCHENGVLEYICPSASCQYHEQSVLIKTAIDPNNHDAVYKDNGDGLTHTATCLYHAEYKNVSENHTFVNGYCTKCAATDYAQATINLTKTQEIYVSLNDTAAKLSVGAVSLKVGAVDVTDSYTISYSWMDQNGTVVGNSKEFTLPSTVTAKEGDYTYGCSVMAMPKAGTAGKYIIEACTVTVRVRELVRASATMTAGDAAMTLAATNSRTTISVVQQIYQAAYNLSSGYPTYVIFSTPTTASEVGVFSANSSAYYFSPTATQQALSSVTFVPLATGAGAYTVNFTVYDNAGKNYHGVLTFNVEQDLGSLDVSYATTSGTAVNLSSLDFAAFWQEKYDRGTLSLVKFKSLPAITNGALYYNYVPGAVVQTLVSVTDSLYSSYTSADQKLISGVTFVPDAKYTGNIIIPFEAHGMTAQGQYTILDGKLNIFVSSGAARAVSYTVNSGNAVKLSAADFLSVYQLMTGTVASDFTVKFLGVPANGALYMDYTGSVQNTPLTAANVTDFSFHYNSSIGKEIADLTYLAPKVTAAVTDTVRYVVCDSKGTFLYVGELAFTVKPTVVVYTKSFTDVVKTASTEWYYTAVMDLAEAGIINGMTSTTFEPSGKVTYGQALKLIMLAAGYEKQVEEGGPNWAKNYLAIAQRDGLISATYTETILNRVIARNEIAQIAAKALKLPTSALTVSPFTDVVVGSTYAPYIFSLYDAGIITGTELSNGTTVYYGVNAITRAEMSVIVWRINNYRK